MATAAPCNKQLSRERQQIWWLRAHTTAMLLATTKTNKRELLKAICCSCCCWCSHCNCCIFFFLLGSCVVLPRGVAFQLFACWGTMLFFVVVVLLHSDLNATVTLTVSVVCSKLKIRATTRILRRGRAFAIRVCMYAQAEMLNFIKKGVLFGGFQPLSRGCASISGNWFSHTSLIHTPLWVSNAFAHVVIVFVELRIAVRRIAYKAFALSVKQSAF